MSAEFSLPKPVLLPVDGSGWAPPPLPHVPPPLPHHPPPVPNLAAPARPQAAVRGAFLPHFWHGIISGADWLFGFVSLVFGLAVLAVIPVLNFISLGYLLHVSGRVATTGRLRDGFVGIRKASRLGSFVAGTWLVLWPVRFVSDLWRDSHLISASSQTTQVLRLLLVATTFLTLAHIVWACLRGGRLRHFFWPAPMKFFRWLRSPDKYQKTNAAMGRFIASLRLPYYFWLGLRGFGGALVWLALPALLLWSSTLLGKDGLILAVPGLLLLVIVSMHLPFLQTHFALQGRFGSLFEIREVRRLFRRAPLAYGVALLASLLFALPLYLLKVELTPRELAFLPSLLFVVFIFPARLLTGWALGRALRQENPRHPAIRWLGRFTIVPVALIYAIFVYFMVYLTWNGASSLLEQHAFMVPAPLMSF